MYMKGYTLEDKSPDQSIELWKDLFLRLTVNKRFQRLYHDQPDFEILLGKLIAQIGGLNLNLFFANYVSMFGYFMQSLDFLIPLVVTCILMP